MYGAVVTAFIVHITLSSEFLVILLSDQRLNLIQLKGLLRCHFQSFRPERVWISPFLSVSHSVRNVGMLREVH